MKNNVRQMTLAAMMAALQTVLLYLGSVLPSGRLAMAALAGVLGAVIVIECGYPHAAMAWVVASALGMLLFPRKGSALFFAAFLTLIVGLFPLMFVKRGNHKMTSKEGNFIVVVLWFTACLFGAFPFLFYGGPFSVVNSLFESVSGFTTTGASILEDVESIPAGLQFWRISTAWVGGMGVVTLFSMLVVRGMDQSVLYGAELSSVATRTVQEKKASFAKQMLVTYITLTLVTFFSLKLSGMRWFDSAVNAMSTCSTCGFSTRISSMSS